MKKSEKLLNLINYLRRENIDDHVIQMILWSSHLEIWEKAYNPDIAPSDTELVNGIIDLLKSL